MIALKRFLKRFISQSSTLELLGFAPIFRQLNSSRLPQTLSLRQRFHLSTLWLKSVKQQAATSLFLPKQSVTTHVSEVASYRQALDLVEAVFLKISVLLWRARKNLAQIKRSNSFVRLMQLTFAHVNALLMLCVQTFQKISLNIKLLYSVQHLSLIAMMCATPQLSILQHSYRQQERKSSFMIQRALSQHVSVFLIWIIKRRLQMPLRAPMQFCT